MALHIALNYFETIRFFLTADKDERTGIRFKAGVKEVFPDQDDLEILQEILYKNVRSGLYHALAANPLREYDVRIDKKDDTSVFYRGSDNIWIIDPHNLIRRLRQHFEEYVKRLKDPEQADARASFEKAFDMRVLGKE